MRSQLAPEMLEGFSLLRREGWSRLSLLKPGVWEMIWLFEGTLPLPDTITSSPNVFIRVSRNFGTTEDTEESDGKTIHRGCEVWLRSPGCTIFFPDFSLFLVRLIK